MTTLNVPKGQIVPFLKMKEMKDKKYYMLVTKRGNPIVKGAQLPIYWLKKVAMREALYRKCYLSEVYVKRIIHKS